MDTSNAGEPQMQTFFIRIHPQHSHFIELMTPREEAIMHQHFLYWKGELQRHRLFLAGPVPIDPGTFGIIIVRAESEREAESMIQADPADADANAAVRKRVA
jgi:uncharacterized protein YciI